VVKKASKPVVISKVKFITKAAKPAATKPKGR
jgi:hypothetical protein